MNLELLLEAERRGILPPDKAALLAEARKRGLVPGGQTPAKAKPVDPAVMAAAVARQAELPGIGVAEGITAEGVPEGLRPQAPAVGGAMGNTARQAVQGATFGFGDEITAGLTSLAPGIGYDEALGAERERLAQGDKDYPVSSTIAEIVGAVAMPVGAARFSGNLPARMAKSAGAGTAMAGAYGFGTGEGGVENRAIEAAKSAPLGAAVGGFAPLVGAGVQKVADSLARSRAIKAAAAGAPASDALRAQGNAAYDAVDAAGVQIRPQAFDDARKSIIDALRSNTAFDELPGASGLTPKSARVVQMMGEAGEQMATDPTAALPFKALDQMRRRAGVAAGDVANKSDAAAGSEIIAGLDDFVGRLGPNDVIAGDVTALQAAIPKARDIWRRMSKSQLLDDAIEAGGDYLSGTGSGIRNQFKNILRNPKLVRNFTQAEIAAMRRVANGTLPEKLVQIAGGGLGNIATAAAGAAAGGWPGLAIGTMGAGLMRAGSDAITRRNAEMARALVANGKLANLPVASPAARSVVEALIRRGAAAGVQ